MHGIFWRSGCFLMGGLIIFGHVDWNARTWLNRGRVVKGR